MSDSRLAAIWDALARQSAAVVGIKAAYATGTGGQGATVRQYPTRVGDGPVAIIDYAGSTIEHRASELITHDFEIALWTPLSTREAAVVLLAPMFGRFHNAFDLNIGLYGTCDQAVVDASSPFEDETLNEQDYLVQRLTVTAQETLTRTHSMGPSS